MPEVVLEGLRKGWGGTVALPNLDLRINDGEFLVLLGPSGCGKTTTMRMVAGLETPDAGRILIGGRDVTAEPPRDRDVAMVFQNYGLYPHMTVAENIGYPLRLRGIPRAEMQAKVLAAAQRVELEMLLDRKPRALSGGQRQRVALARAIVRRPRLFLMDEPLSNLDARLRVTMRAELKRLHHELGTTVIYVTHDQIEAMTLATRVAVMRTGEIMQLGPPEAIYGDPETRFVASFVGTPPMSFLRVGPNSALADGQRLAIPAPANGALHLGVRPEDVLVGGEPADLTGSVFAVEYTGASRLVTLWVGPDHLTATLPPDQPEPQIDARVGVRLNRAGIFWFDAETERRVRG
jgi:multiple sugar transport system ATP-binding protein